MKTFSQLAKELPKGRLTKLACKLGKDFTKEFNRRMKEFKAGKCLCLYRPWDER